MSTTLETNNSDDYLDITVAIPTYNGEKRLPQVLDHLLNQTGIEHFKWEIIVIDNNSSDNTSNIVSVYQEKNQEQPIISYYVEHQQGVGFARLRAVREAKGNLVAFLDDDNLPDPNWLFAAYEFGLKYPTAGAWGGQIHANFEVNPPENFAKIQAFLAIREHGNKPYIFDADNLRLPPGAALVVRKQVWCEHVPKQPTLSGALPGGDDYEALLHIHKSGWQVWYNPEMHTYHQIPKWRLEKDYLMRLAYGYGLCTFQLRLINTKKWQMLIIFIRTVLSNLRRILKHMIEYRQKIYQDLIIMFEIKFYWGSMLSPFYSIQLYFQRLRKSQNKI
ncbi:glycosyl transferase, family 2 [Richelia sinica FACHB-800]|uniref:Glycosyl transferase, family 2 n=1 Tax=Richelia sinica FACHB-800 TaxID=1357546 RepID=A0A975Y6X2_9NOST|nr:hormogonium polysaccharide biosynthesis glycosyltransferase HpsE [Richelia sinica]MBD2665437.1 glycosyltransferase family 2 protein [Richelia sinica FACHB-800]QXE25709.1 glycosyl transferase, family 2 [Richelia sinica FACHB-800]